MLTQEDLKNLKETLKESFVTQDYFDSALLNVLEKLDKIDRRFDIQTAELKDYTHQAFEVQQEYMDERFGELIMHYDVRDRVDRLEREFMEFKLKSH
jgi:hypothetical protein